jgi:hypothetical protein
MYWAALNTCTHPEESGKKERGERERYRRTEGQKDRRGR